MDKRKIGIGVLAVVLLAGLIIAGIALGNHNPESSKEQTKKSVEELVSGEAVSAESITPEAVETTETPKSTKEPVGEKAESEKEQKAKTEKETKKTKEKAKKNQSKAQKENASTETKKKTQSTVNTVEKITFSGTSIKSTGTGCHIDGKVATIKKAGSYEVTGTLSEGQLIVAASKTDHVSITLNGVSITCPSSAPFYVKSADKVTLTILGKNILKDGKTYQFASGVTEPDAALYSEDDITFKGSGSLYVTGNYRDGIACKNDIHIEGSTLHVIAADDGIRGKDSIEMTGGNVSVTSLSHGLKTSEDKDTTKGYIKIAGGTLSIDAEGDGFHTTRNITVSGGNTTVKAKNEGIDSDGSFTITGGNFTLFGPKSEKHYIHQCKNGLFLNGGTFIATGSSLAKTVNSASKQNFVFYKFAKEQEKDTTVKLDKSGKTVVSFKVSKKYQCIIVSSSKISKGTYGIYCGSTKADDYKVG